MILDVLERVSDTANAIPPVDNKASRFGNPAFRTFYDKVSEVRSSIPSLCAHVSHVPEHQIAPELHKSIPGLPEAAIPEVSVYFTEAWGNRTRIDYGSGMELNFLCWMYVLRLSRGYEVLTDIFSRICLEKLGVVQESDHVALVIKVFWR